MLRHEQRNEMQLCGIQKKRQEQVTSTLQCMDKENILSERYYAYLLLIIYLKYIM